MSCSWGTERESCKNPPPLKRMRQRWTIGSKSSSSERLSTIGKKNSSEKQPMGDSAVWEGGVCRICDRVAGLLQRPFIIIALRILSTIVRLSMHGRLFGTRFHPTAPLSNARRRSQKLRRMMPCNILVASAWDLQDLVVPVVRRVGCGSAK